MSEELRKQIFRQSISKMELERRWKTVRTEMAKAKIDALITHSAGRFLGGMVRYFTDIQMSSYGGAVIFPLAGDMTLITSGAPNVEPKIDPVIYNTQSFSRPFIPSMNYAKDKFPAIAVDVFRKSKPKTIGIVEKNLFPLSFYEYMKEKLTNVKFVDATDMVEDIRSVKSEEEINLMQKRARCLLRIPVI